MKNKEYLVIWNIYFDSDVSREKGRKLSKREAVTKPSLEEIANALKILNYKIINIKKAKYPSMWWRDDDGYILIEKKGKNKLSIIREIAKEIRRMRGGK